MKKVFILILVVCFCSTAFLEIAKASMLTNGDAELGDLIGWTTDYSGATSGNTAIINSVSSAPGSHSLLPHSGDYLFSFAEQASNDSWNEDSTVSMFQRGSIGSMGIFYLSGYYATNLDDYAEVILSYYDASDQLLGSMSSGILNTLPVNLEWTYFEFSSIAPDTAVTWEVTLAASVLIGNFSDVYLDDIELVAAPVPEPGTMLLLGTGLAGLAATRIRRKKK